jgi:hypothetical protein
VFLWKLRPDLGRANIRASPPSVCDKQQRNHICSCTVICQI